MKKNERQAFLLEALSQNPFITDEALATLLSISIPTVRLYRQELSIPEVRKRTKDMATKFFGGSQSLAQQEIFGESLEIEPGKHGLSLLETDRSMCLEKCDIIRGHIIFAMANSLANAIIALPVALTAQVEANYLRTVRAGERLLAKATVIDKQGRRFIIKVSIKTGEQLVFEGKFVIYGMNLEAAQYLHILREIEQN